MALQEGDLVLCTVKQIEGTSVFVELPEGKHGTIVTSEIAPGRIRNIREYVMPNKKIVCKVLRISQNNIDLSLRRVTSKEKTEVMELFKQEQTAKSALNSLLKEKAKDIEESILKEFKTLAEFFNKAKEDENIVIKYIPKDAQEQVLKIVQKRKKDIEVQKIVKLKCLEKDGINRVRKILENEDTTIEITYISAGNFQIKIKNADYKKANIKMNEFLAAIEKRAKANVCEYSFEEKK